MWEVVLSSSGCDIYFLKKDLFIEFFRYLLRIYSELDMVLGSAVY